MITISTPTAIPNKIQMMVLKGKERPGFVWMEGGCDPTIVSFPIGVGTLLESSNGEDDELESVSNPSKGDFVGLERNASSVEFLTGTSPVAEGRCVPLGENSTDGERVAIWGASVPI
jgi:hypothetical protein